MKIYGQLFSILLELVTIVLSANGDKLDKISNIANLGQVAYIFQNMQEPIRYKYFQK